jgi:hypothetical protein
MAERRTEGQMRSGSRVTARRLRDFEERRRELTEAFVLPKDIRKWVTVRTDDDEETPDRVSVGASAGRTVTVVSYPLPAGLRKELREFLKEHDGDLEHQLKIDMASNLLAMMTGTQAGEIAEAEATAEEAK